MFVFSVTMTEEKKQRKLQAEVTQPPPRPAVPLPGQALTPPWFPARLCPAWPDRGSKSVPRAQGISGSLVFLLPNTQLLPGPKLAAPPGPPLSWERPNLLPHVGVPSGAGE